MFAFIFAYDIKGGSNKKRQDVDTAIKKIVEPLNGVATPCGKGDDTVILCVVPEEKAFLSELAEELSDDSEEVDWILTTVSKRAKKFETVEQLNRYLAILRDK